MRVELTDARLLSRESAGLGCLTQLWLTNSHRLQETVFTPQRLNLVSFRLLWSFVNIRAVSSQSISRPHPTKQTKPKLAIITQRPDNF